jgi:RNA polymerase-binding transcription factor DksA
MDTSVRQEAKKFVNNRILNLDEYKAALISKASSLAREKTNACEIESSYRLLHEVEYALWRMDRGRYGVCLKCEEAIEQDRLDCQPWALFCADCQRTVDLLQRGALARRKELSKAAAA